LFLQTWPAVSDSRLTVEHARILLPIKLLKKSFLLYDMGKLCSKFGEDRSINNITIMSTDAGWTNRHVKVILYSVQCYALHWTDNYYQYYYYNY